MQVGMTLWKCVEQVNDNEDQHQAAAAIAVEAAAAAGAATTKTLFSLGPRNATSTHNDGAKRAT